MDPKDQNILGDSPGGLSVRALAKITGVSPSTIHRDIVASRNGADENGLISVGKTLGNDGKLRPSRRFDTTDRDEQIIAMHADKISMRKIAAAVGCSVGTVHRVLKDS